LISLSKKDFCMKKTLLKKGFSHSSSQDSSLPALRPTMLLVLGMHRSGTSVTARLLECLGAKNSENLTGTGLCNPHGYFEDNDVYKFNDSKLLPRLDRAWHSTSEVDWSNLSDADRSKYALQALEIVKKNYPLSNTLSVLKEPRLGILVPFWLAVLQHAGFNTKVVCAVRDPVSVIRSLNKAEGLSLPHAGMVFINYWLSILKYCKDLEVAFVQYDEIFVNPAKSLRDVAAKLSLPLPQDFEERVHHFSSSFFDKNLRHNKFDTKDLVLESDLPPLAIELYKSLLSAAQAQNIKKTIKFVDAARGSTEALQSTFLEFDRLISQVHSTNARVHELQTALDAERAAGNSIHLSGLVNERDGRIAGLEGAVNERDGRIAGLEGAVSECNGRIAGLEGAVSERDGRIAGLEGAVNERDGRIAGLEGAVNERDGRIAGLEGAVSERDGRIAGLEGAVSERDGRIAGLEGAVNELQSERDSLASERSTLDARLSTLSSEHSALVTSHSLLVAERDSLASERSTLSSDNTSLATSNSLLATERDALSARLSTLSSERASLVTSHSSLFAERDDLATRHQQLATEREALSTDLQERFEELAKLAKLQLSTEDERNALQTKVSELQAERESLASRLSTLLAERDDLAARHQQLATEREALSTDLSQRFEEIALLGKRLLEVEVEGNQRVAALQARMDAMQARLTWKLGAPARFVWDKTRNIALKIYRLPTAWRILRLHRSSGLFNHEWYYRQNPDVKAITTRPFLHFAFHGVFEGRTPNPSYNESAYLKHTQSAQSSSMKPLLHYTLKGWKGKSS
jgi:hypothetical protein